MRPPPPAGEVYFELSRAFEDSDPEFLLNAHGATGSTLQIGIVSNVACINGAWDVRYIPTTHDVYEHVGGIHEINPPTSTAWAHRSHHAISAMIPFNRDTNEYAGVFEAEFHVFNQLRGSDYGVSTCGGVSPQSIVYGLEEFVERKVRLVTQAAWPTSQDSALIGWYARHFDLMYFQMAGNLNIQEHGEWLDIAIGNRVACNYLGNYLCVGGFEDTQYDNEGTSADLTDDTHASFSRWENQSNRDVDFPHVSARAADVQVATSAPNSMTYRNNTDVSASIAAAIAGLQVELFNGDWRRCRWTEWMRANMVLRAGHHSVDGMVTAYHEGHHEHFGDHRSGWGAVTPDPRVLRGHWYCGSNPDPGDDTACMPSLDPNGCDLPETPADDSSIPVPLPQGHQTVQDNLRLMGVVPSRGKLLEEVTLSPNRGLRGVLAWSACPFSDWPDAVVYSPYMVDFNLWAIPVGATDPNDWIDLSYSRDSTIEAFEFIPDQQGDYQIWRIATRDDWDIYCTYDNPGSRIPDNPINGEYTSYQSYRFTP